jgi:phosphatidylethanolamine-binding protein (PEBP) family uncharacterized protein
MRRSAKTSLSAVLVSALLAGCGSGSGSSTTAEAVPSIVVKSAAVVHGVLPARYTCDGQDVFPPMEWGAVPAGASNLALFLVGFTPEPATKTYKVTVEWAVAGLNPALHRLTAGRLPAGAYVGLATGGKQRRYSICPERGQSVHYQFELYGVPRSLALSPQFTDESLLASLTSAHSSTRADAHGGFVALYKRPARPHA